MLFGLALPVRALRLSRFGSFSGSFLQNGKNVGDSASENVSGLANDLFFFLFQPFGDELKRLLCLFSHLRRRNLQQVI